MTAGVRTAPARTRLAVAADLRRGLVLGVARGRIELKQFFRNTGAAVFLFAFPMIMLALMASIFKGHEKGVDTRQIYATGMLSVGVISSSFQALVMQVTSERQGGALKRLRATPMPKLAYFVGKVILVAVSSVAQAAIMLTLGSLFFGLHLPTDPAKWVTFGWVFLLGLTGCTMLGLGVSRFVKNSESGMVVTVPFLVLQFISGVFIVFADLPKGLQDVAAVFPLKWLCQGMRSVFLPDGYQSVEPAGTWEHGRVALVLGAWAVLGLVLCLKTFRWKDPEDG
jgi:ABC-2 type transport system permease protein